jgi:hypothetical protein
MILPKIYGSQLNSRQKAGREVAGDMVYENGQ